MCRIIKAMRSDIVIKEAGDTKFALASSRVDY